MKRLMNRSLYSAIALGVLVSGLCLVAGCPTPKPNASLVLTPATSRPTASPSTAPSTTAPTPNPNETPMPLLTVGDIASAASPGDEATSQLVDGLSGPILTLGDHVYENGTPTEFAQVYDPSWGRHKSRTRPVPGNHEYNTPNAAGYFGYFGAAAGAPDKGFYAFDVGPNWRVLVINSELELRIAETGAESRQYDWIKQELESNAGKNVIAAWHHPRYSSGPHNDTPLMDAIWDLCVDRGVDLVLSGHDHMYERFAPIGKQDERDDAKGIRSFVVGTGGAERYPLLDTPDANSEVQNTDTWGVMKLNLYANRYTWEFQPVEGQSFRDQGEGLCH